MEIAVKTAGDALFTAKSLTDSLDHASVLKNTFVHEEKEFSIIAINNEMSGRVLFSNLHSKICRDSFGCLFGDNHDGQWDFVLVGVKKRPGAFEKIEPGNQADSGRQSGCRD